MNTDNASLMLEVALSLFPEIISNSLLDDPSFIHRFGVETTSRITFGDSAVSFDSKNLFDAVSIILSTPGSKSTAKDVDGDEWELSVESDSGGKFTLLACGDRRAKLPYFWPLSPCADIRVSQFDKEAELNNFNGTVFEGWRSKLSAAPLNTSSIDDLWKDLSLTPTRFAESLAVKLRSEDCSILDLVPREIEYYEALVGPLGQVDSLSNYIRETNVFVSQLMGWNHVKGLKCALLLSSHSQLISDIDLSTFSAENFCSVLEYVRSEGDVFSKVGILELGFEKVKEWPQIQTCLLALISDLIHDSPLEQGGRFSFISSLVVLVIGELSRIKIFKDKPPFWVRLAAIAHASSIERVYLASGGMPVKFKTWVYENRGLDFFMRSLLDMRLEPRWQPEFVSPAQLKFEMLCRVANALKKSYEHLTLPEFSDLLEVDARGASKLLKFPESFLPGPLEGGLASSLPMPEEVLRNLENQLTSDSVNVDSFNSLVNSSLIFNITMDHARLAASALRKVKYQLEQSKGGSNFFALISGLATVAAVTRSKELADEVRVLSRVTRRREDTTLSGTDELRIALISAASIQDFQQWSDFFGDWLTEIAYEVEAGEQSVLLLNSLKAIVELEPDLLSACSKAESSLVLSAH